MVHLGDDFSYNRRTLDPATPSVGVQPGTKKHRGVLSQSCCVRVGNGRDQLVPQIGHPQSCLDGGKHRGC